MPCALSSTNLRGGSACWVTTHGGSTAYLPDGGGGSGEVIPLMAQVLPSIGKIVWNKRLMYLIQVKSLTLSVPQDFHGCTLPFFIYAQNIIVYNLTAHNFVSLKDNPIKVYIKLKGIGCTI